MTEVLDSQKKRRHPNHNHRAQSYTIIPEARRFI